MRHTETGLIYKLVEKQYDANCLVCGFPIDQVVECRIKCSVGDLPELTYAFPACSELCASMWAEVIGRVLAGDRRAMELAVARMDAVSQFT